MNLDITDRFARGELVVLLDDGPDPQPAVLVALAAAIAPQAMAELVRYTSGFVTVALPASRCDTLGLPALAHDPFCRVRPVAAVAVDARLGVSTGISAADRCTTARVLADRQSVTSDLCRPGHVVPMRVPMAAPRGTDPTSRQIFAAMDLCQLIDSPSAVVSSVLVAASGEVMGNGEAHLFAAVRGYPVLPASDVAVPAAPPLALLDGIAS